MEMVKIQITEEEWGAFPKEKREKIKLLLKEQFGYDISMLDELDTSSVDDQFNEFYGDDDE